MWVYVYVLPENIKTQVLSSSSELLAIHLKSGNLTAVVDSLIYPEVKMKTARSWETDRGLMIKGLDCIVWDLHLKSHIIQTKMLT